MHCSTAKNYQITGSELQSRVAHLNHTLADKNHVIWNLSLGPCRVFYRPWSRETTDLIDAAPQPN